MSRMTDLPAAISVRDRIAGALCNAILRTIATPWYRDRIGNYIRIGMATLAAQASLPDHKPEGNDR